MLRCFRQVWSHVPSARTRHRHTKSCGSFRLGEVLVAGKRLETATAKLHGPLGHVDAPTTNLVCFSFKPVISGSSPPDFPTSMGFKGRNNCSLLSEGNATSPGISNALPQVCWMEQLLSPQLTSNLPTSLSHVCSHHFHTSSTFG